MSSEEYKKLNQYLNGIFKVLEKIDPNFLDNLYPLSMLSNCYVQMTNKYKWNKEKTKPNNLTFEQVYNLAREIIYSINPKYIEEYDKMLSNGLLDFSYEFEYEDSQFVYTVDKDTYTWSININREFNYSDVDTLVHEYIHKTNCGKKISCSRVTLTEFLSIYFETYAKDYLLKKGIPKEELQYDERLKWTKVSANQFNWYSLILLAYQELGNIDENTYKLTSEFFFVEISKEEAEKEYRKLLENFEKAEKEYNMNVLYEKNPKEEELYHILANNLRRPYLYILGTVLAFYARENCDIEKIVYLNEHINDENCAYLSLYDLLNSIGINLNSIGIQKFVDIIENLLIELGYEQKEEKVK